MTRTLPLPFQSLFRFRSMCNSLYDKMVLVSHRCFSTGTKSYSKRREKKKAKPPWHCCLVIGFHGEYSMLFYWIDCGQYGLVHAERMQARKINFAEIINSFQGETSNYRQIWCPKLNNELCCIKYCWGVNEQNSIVNWCPCRWYDRRKYDHC